ncbi:hypothetical protein BC936DRAFT_140538 [Jimgerdemannia flammicorona]|uniref:Uncharacterized protein n=1 Tax=Jimgerdemannia flammicorona TaxID=994334 RepID=A0A433APH3_9FUNG|nr:hypothetical protein BC936DRAFT_140538 [Jimgerdemannia flammicorona]
MARLEFRAANVPGDFILVPRNSSSGFMTTAPAQWSHIPLSFHDPSSRPLPILSQSCHNVDLAFPAIGSRVCDLVIW